jgi:hypothetical protein
MVKKVQFRCCDCGRDTIKTAANLNTQKKRLGNNYCADCAKLLGLQKLRNKIASKHPIKNTSVVTVQCACGKSYEVQHRTAKKSIKCQSCIKVEQYQANRSSYDNASRRRIGDAEFSNRVSEAAMRLPEAVRQLNARQNARALWDDPDRRNTELNRRKTAEYKSKMSGALKGINALTTIEFINRARQEHGDVYDYTETVYTHSKHKVTIICAKHGAFAQTAADHLYHCNGCQKCAADIEISKPHSELLQFLEGEYCHTNDRVVLDGKEIDVLVNDRLGIEMHGTYWHSYGRSENKKERYKHHDKASIAEKKGLKLIQIFEHEWYQKRDIVLSMINHYLGKSARFDARKLLFKKITSREADCFMDQNHIQGKRSASSNYALVDSTGTAMICATISHHHAYGFELIRSATKMNCCVRGGLSRLIKLICVDLSVKTLMSYADRRYSVASSYLKVGFKLLAITKPGYCYVKGNNAYRREVFQKSKLSRVLEAFDANLSESDNMFRNGYRRLWDAGHYKLLLSV